VGTLGNEEAPRPRPRRRIAIATVVTALGACEAYATSPLTFEGPGWLVGPAVMIGFLLFLVLVGFIGNFLVACAVLWVSWRAWRWPLWLAALLSSPFWLVFYRACPKPW
jgi:hypothetical protein